VLGGNAVKSFPALVPGIGLRFGEWKGELAPVTKLQF
jgi:hypothetical protein